MDKNSPLVGMSKEEILSKIKPEIDSASIYVAERRQTFRDRLKLYNNQRKQREKIGILTIYTTVNTLLAVHYVDDITVEFTPREFADMQFSDNINAVAKFDQEEMGLDEINYLKDWDRFFYGVGLRDISTFDTITNTPIAKSMSPLCWLPDPRGGIDGFRFYGFEVDRTVDEMKTNEAFFNVDKEENAILGIPSEQQATRDAENEAHGLTSVPDLRTDKKLSYQIDWYTSLKNENGKYSKYLLTVNSSCTELYRIEKIEPVTDEEKKDETKVPWPLVTNYYSPQRNNPFGVSVCDLTEDKQRAKSVLANLRISIEKASLYPMYIYNTQSIRNRRDLDFGFNKAIAVTLQKGQPLTDVLLPIQKSQNHAGTFNQEQSLDSEAQISTGADQMQSGVMSQDTRTASEVQQVSLNAKTRFLLGSKIKNIGEKIFWGLWYRLYRQNFSRTQKKIVRFQGGFSIKFVSITRKDFITRQDPDISIVSKIDLSNRRAQERLSFSQIAPLLLQDPTKPQASKDFTMRYLMKLNGIAPDIIAVLAPESPGEMDSRNENELLSRNMIAKLQINDDHLSHMVIHSSAEDTNAKFAHIEAHKQAYILSGQKEKADLMAQEMMTNAKGAANNAMNSVNEQANNLLISNNQRQPLDIGIK